MAARATAAPMSKWRIAILVMLYIGLLVLIGAVKAWLK